MGARCNQAHALRAHEMQALWVGCRVSWELAAVGLVGLNWTLLGDKGEAALGIFCLAFPSHRPRHLWLVSWCEP